MDSCEDGTGPLASVTMANSESKDSDMCVEVTISVRASQLAKAHSSYFLGASKAGTETSERPSARPRGARGAPPATLAPEPTASSRKSASTRSSLWKNATNLATDGRCRASIGSALEA